MTKTLSLSILAAALIAPILACKNADPITGPPTAVNVAGTWTGTFVLAADPFFYDCASNVQATATFTQQGSVVGGLLYADPHECGFNNVTFQGTLDGTNLTGTIRGGGSRFGFAEGSTAHGFLSDTTLTLTLTNNRYHDPSPHPGGTGSMHLRR